MYMYMFTSVAILALGHRRFPEGSLWFPLDALGLRLSPLVLLCLPFGVPLDINQTMSGAIARQWNKYEQ